MNDAPKYEGSTDELVKLGYFAEMAKDIAAARSITGTLDQIMHHVGAIFAPANWSILLRDRQSGDLRFTLITGSAVDTLKGKIVPKGKGIAGWIAENGMPLIVEDVRRDSRFDDSYDRIAGFETRSIIGVPLKTATAVFGVIELVNTLEERAFTPLDLKFLTTIADFGAIAIEKAYYLSALRRVSSHDSLTGLPNRVAFFAALRRRLETAARDGATVAVGFIDVDELKRINDGHGHAVGDAVLESVARRLAGTARVDDVIARLSGDEFAFVSAPTAGSLELDGLAERLIDAACRPVRAGGAVVPVTISLGLVRYPGDATTADDLIAAADRAMYAAKSTGGGTWRSVGG